MSSRTGVKNGFLQTECPEKGIKKAAGPTNVVCGVLF